MSDQQNLKFVIVGHVDHGKSTLIGRLLYERKTLSSSQIEEIEKGSAALGRDTELAFLIDSFKEERDQGITIDTAQVFFTTDKRRYVIIDAPGHVEFVKNMITGASQADAAVLIIAAPEGVEEQTKRHAYILHLLGLKQVIVVINKMDLVEQDQERFIQVKNELQDFLSALEIKPLYYIPISAKKGDNIAWKSKSMRWYNGVTVIDALDSLSVRQSLADSSLLLPIQDAYKIDNKRIYVGKLAAGKIVQGQAIKILPEGQVTRVKSIEKFLETRTECSAGESIGITTSQPVFVERGNIVCVEDAEPVLRTRFRANVMWLSKSPFTPSEKISIRCTTQECGCSIEKILKKIDSSSLQLIESDSPTIRNLELAEIIIKTEKPFAVGLFSETEDLGRFVLVHREDVCAGGIIVDTDV